MCFLVTFPDASPRHVTMAGTHVREATRTPLGDNTSGENNLDVATSVADGWLEIEADSKCAFQIQLLSWGQIESRG